MATYHFKHRAFVVATYPVEVEASSEEEARERIRECDAEFGVAQVNWDSGSTFYKATFPAGHLYMEDELVSVEEN